MFNTVAALCIRLLARTLRIPITAGLIFWLWVDFKSISLCLTVLFVGFLFDACFGTLEELVKFTVAQATINDATLDFANAIVNLVENEKSKNKEEGDDSNEGVTKFYTPL